MKKTVTKPDGTTVVFEGTSEEIAELERKLRESLQEAPPAKKPGLLKGSSELSDADVQRIADEFIRRNGQIPMPPRPMIIEIDWHREDHERQTKWPTPGLRSPWWGDLPNGTIVCGTSVPPAYIIDEERKKKRERPRPQLPAPTQPSHLEVTGR